MSRSADEIARVLDAVKAQRKLVTAYLPGMLFQSLLRLADGKAGRIVLEPSPVAQANRALLRRPRCTFHCELPGWHIEFVAAEPRPVMHERSAAIQCRFPEILVSHHRRQHERIEVKPPLPLRVEADAGGIMPFDARIIDMSLGGIGFLVYADNITLEPGTVLRGCRIELPGGKACIADLEVRYSQPVTFPSGRRAMRSGCRFLTAPLELLGLIAAPGGRGPPRR
jgi:c-di-GMP-binding flagellar brake protein YcgR